MVAPSLLQSALAIGATLAMTAARRTAVTLAGYLAAGVLLAASLVFLTLSAYRAIDYALGDVYAALIVGAAYFMASLIALLVVSFSRR
jgi:hypothetical protein